MPPIFKVQEVADDVLSQAKQMLSILEWFPPQKTPKVKIS